MAANLTYYIWEGILTGYANGKTFHIPALSGGAGGSTKHLSGRAANNPYMEGLKAAGRANAPRHVHGGPIPPGKYTIKKPAHHPHLGPSAKLVHPHFKPIGRDGFYIHGRGPHGSEVASCPLIRSSSAS